MGNKGSAISLDTLTSKKNEQAIDKIWKELDKNKSNTLDRREFAVLISRVLKEFNFTFEKPPNEGSFKFDNLV